VKGIEYWRRCLGRLKAHNGGEKAAQTHRVPGRTCGSRYSSGCRTDVPGYPHQGYPEMALPCKDLKNVTLRYSVEEPSKNRLESSCIFSLFLLLSFKRLTTLGLCQTKRNKKEGGSGEQTPEGLSRHCCLLTKADSIILFLCLKHASNSLREK